MKEVSIGPTSLMSLLTLQYTLDKPPQYAIVLTFLAGCIELLMGFLKLGKYYRCVSSTKNIADAAFRLSVQNTISNLKALIPNCDGIS